jgi:sugar phosphate isomerase/epimerase
MLKFATRAFPLAKRLGNAYQSGFRYVELSLTAKLVDDWRQIAATADSFDLRYELHFPNRAPLTHKQLKRIAKLYCHLDCQVMVIHQPMFRLYSKDMADLVPGLCLAVENHHLNPKSFWQWAETHQWLTLDVEHLWKHTLNQAPLPDLLEALKKFLKKHGSQLRRVHLPGYEPGGWEHQPASFNPEMARKVLTALSKIDYRGLVVSEARPSMQKLKYLKNDVAMYQSWKQDREAKLHKTGRDA